MRLRAVGLFLLVSVWASAQNAPKMVLEDPIKDFGTVVRGEVLDCSFAVKNTGAADLIISDARPSCGCTIAQFDKVIKPGQIGKINAKLETKDFKGPINKTITVVSNDLENPNAKLFLKANVKAVVDILPDGNLRFTKLKREPFKVQRLLVTEESGFDFKVVKTEASQPWITITAAPAPKENMMVNYPNAQYEITATIGPEAPVGMANETATITTNSPKMPILKIKVLGLVRPDVMASPPKLEMGAVEATSDFTRMVRVRDNSKSQTFEILSSSITLPFFTVVQDVMKKGEEFILELKFNTTPPKGEFAGKIIIRTNSAIEEYKTIEIPVTGSVK
jgi:hypothetical protein